MIVCFEMPFCKPCDGFLGVGISENPECCPETSWQHRPDPEAGLLWKDRPCVPDMPVRMAGKAFPAAELGGRLTDGG
jgi:hypothetical protein